MDPSLRLEGWSFHERLCDPLDGTIGPILNAWRNQVAPDNPSNFEKRLLWDKLTLEQASWALAPSLEHAPDMPPWLLFLQEIREGSRQPYNESALKDRGDAYAFVHVWRPVAHWALDVLKKRCASLNELLLMQDEAWLDLGEALLKRLCHTTDQALYALFEERRTPGQMLLAHLGPNSDGSGEPVHEAYDTFVAEILSSGFATLLEPYPVLGRLLADLIQLWLESNEEMLIRLANSRALLAEQFSIPSSAHLKAIQLDVSDPHRGGRVVMILQFESEEGEKRLVYKPRDLQVDLIYQDILRQLNIISFLPPLRVLEGADLGGFGFMEWVEHQPCTNDEQLASFYVNSGRIMALLYLLGCTDCHHENLIASGDQLILIDTETLLEPEMRDLISQCPDASESISALQSSINESVLRTGLLPHWLLLNDGRRPAVDISALGIPLPPREHNQPGWLGVNSDGMMPGYVLRRSELPTSLPYNHTNERSLTDFLEELCSGFVAQLREAIRLRSQLLDALQRFHGKPRRLVARPTRVYFTLQTQLLQPSSLRSAVAQGLILEQLCRIFLWAQEKPLTWPIFAAEVNQIKKLDIPYFEHLIDGEDLPLPEGLPTIQGMFFQSGLASARKRIRALDEAEINLQEQLVRGAISARMITSRPMPATRLLEDKNQADPLSTQPRISSKDYQQEALRLADQLWESAILDRQGYPEWLGIDLEADGDSFNFGMIGSSLFSGGSGIALSLARLATDGDTGVASRWGDRVWPCLFKLDALVRSDSKSDLFRFIRDIPLGLVGSGGLLLALFLLSQAGYNDADALSRQLLKEIKPDRIQADETLDIIGGVAGLVGPLLISNEPGAKDLAVVCGERLLSLERPDGGWTTRYSKSPLTGFSHGAAGIAAALSRLGKESGDLRFVEAALRSLKYEQSVYVQQQRNWPDFRRTREANVYMRTWCHGAPGILLSRLVLQEHGIMDLDISNDICAARATTLDALQTIAEQPGSPANLCCGLFGLTSILRLDAKVRRKEPPAEVFAAEAKVIERARSGSDYTFFQVDRGSLNLPGLFTGRAGVLLALQEASNGLRWLGPILSAGLIMDPGA